MIFQRALDVLCEHLRGSAEIQAQIFPHWVEPDVPLGPTSLPIGTSDPIPNGVISLILVAAPNRMDVALRPEPMASRPLVPADPVALEYLWSLGHYTVQAQMDIWTKHRSRLDALDHSVLVAMNRGDLSGSFNGHPVGDGLKLSLASPNAPEWIGSAEFDVSGPERSATAGANNRREWRSTYQVDIALEWAIWARTARIAQLALELRVGVDPDSLAKVTVIV